MREPTCFAEKLRLKVKRDEAGDPIIPGKRGHIYEHDAETLGVLLEYPTARRWNWARRKLEAAAFTIWQDGDTEGTALFDPNNQVQAKLALQLVGIKRKRRAKLSQAFLEARKRSQFKLGSVVERTAEGQKAPIPRRPHGKAAQPSLLQP